MRKSELQPPTIQEIATDNEHQAKSPEVEFKDAELLGKSFRVRLAIQENGAKAMTSIEKFKASARNLVSEPKNYIKKKLYERAEASAQRKEDRANTDGISDRLRDHRQAIAEKHREKADMRKADYDEHSAKMANRLDRVDNKSSERTTEIRENRESYMNRAAEAQMRKETRKQLKEEGAGFFERRKLVKEIMETVPKDKKKELGAAILLGVAAEKREKGAERAINKIGNYQDRQEETVSKLTEKYDEYQEELRHLEQMLKEYQDKLDDLNQKREQAVQKKLAADNKWSRLGINDEEREQTKQESIEAGEAIHEVDALIISHSKNATKIESQIVKHNKTLNSLREKRFTAESNARQATIKQKSAKANLLQSKDQHTSYKDNHNQAIDNLLNPNKGE